MSYTWKSDSITVFDSNICRLCAEIRDSLLYIFDSESSVNGIYCKLKKCFPTLNIDKEDSKPKKVCLSCVSKLDLCNELFDVCLASESKFNSILEAQANLQGNKKSVSDECETKECSNCIWPTYNSKTDEELTVHDGGVIVLSKMESNLTDPQNNSNNNRDFVVMVELKYKDDCRSVVEKPEIDVLNIQNKLQSLITYTGDSIEVNMENLDKKHSDTSYITSIDKSVDSDTSNSQIVLFESSPLGNRKEKIVSFSNIGHNKSMDSCDKSAENPKTKLYGKCCYGKKSFVCNVCNKHFHRRTRLNSHMAVHTDVKPFSCDQCDASFVMKWDLTLHQRIHSRIFECRFCKNVFITKSKLDRHLRTHTGEKPHVCDYCSVSFSDKRNLVNHLRTHTGEKPFVCNLCDRQFRVKTHLTDHLRVHTKEMPFKCLTCGKTFRWKANFNMHTKIHSATN